MHTISPQRTDRVESVDMVRGLALFGILLIHAPIFANPGAPAGWEYAGSWPNRLLLYGLICLIDAKFFSLFAGLFGVSFALQWQGAQRRGRPFAPLFRRRLLFLGLFGALHILLLWEGDILLLYAAVGLLLIPLSSLPPERLLRWVGWLLAVPLGFYLVALLGLMLARLEPSAAAWLQQAEGQFSADFAATRAAVIDRYASNDWLAAAVERVGAYITNSPLLLTRMPAVLAMFLLGLYVGKSGLLRDMEGHRATLRRACRWGLGLGLASSLLVTLAYSQLSPFAALTAIGINQVLAGPLLAVGYAAAFLLLVRSEPWSHRFQPLAAYGRMALTNYLLQSAFCAAIFYGTGLGLVAQLAPIQALALAVAINLLLIRASVWWLRHFSMGPVEWLWRTLTQGRSQPFRLHPRPDGRPAPMGQMVDT